jgi:hypothetical protein
MGRVEPNLPIAYGRPPMTTPAIQAALDTLVDAIRAELRGEFLAVLGGSAPSPKRRGPGRPKGSARASVVKAKRRTKGGEADAR